MMSQPTSRQALYDRIRQSSKEEVILEEMIRLGFWPESSGKPNDPAEEIRRRGELEHRLRGLTTEKARLDNVDALRREMHKRRLLEARQRRAETKERRLRERAERAELWRQRKERDLVYLGEGVSAGLGRSEGNAERLSAQGLPAVSSAAELAGAMGVSVGELRFLAFQRTTSRTTHYARFTIPKRSGGERVISAPMPRLKAVQQWILREILAVCEPHPAAHGFRPGRSIVTNAAPHVGAEVVVNVDLKDFFPTVSYRRVKGVFAHLGYSESAATILALLCTEPNVDEVELDGVTYYVAMSDRFLPQGAPTSPAITNVLCRRLDRRLSKAAAALGFVYTRYADDLSFSGSGPANRQVGRLLRRVAWIVGQEGFSVHPDKTRVFRKGRRQEVTGLVVNERLGVPRSALRRLRATLFQLEKDGPEGKRWGQSEDVLAAVLGFANYVAMVDPGKGAPLQARARALLARYGEEPGPEEGAQAGAAAPEAGQGALGGAQGSADLASAAHGEDGSPGAHAPAAEPGEEPPEPTGGSDQGKAKKKWWKIF